MSDKTGQQTQEAPTPVLFQPEPVHFRVYRGLDNEMLRGARKIKKNKQLLKTI